MIKHSIFYIFVSSLFISGCYGKNEIILPAPPIANANVKLESINLSLLNNQIPLLTSERLTIEYICTNNLPCPQNVLDTITPNTQIQISNQNVIYAANNRVFGKALGISSISVVNENIHSNLIDVEVIAVTLDSIIINENTPLTLSIGGKINLQAEAVFSNGLKKDITQDAFWAISNNNIAQINQLDQLFGYHSGQTNLSATLANKTQTASVVVDNNYRYILQYSSGKAITKSSALISDTQNILYREPKFTLKLQNNLIQIEPSTDQTLFPNLTTSGQFIPTTDSNGKVISFVGYVYSRYQAVNTSQPIEQVWHVAAFRESKVALLNQNFPAVFLHSTQPVDEFPTVHHMNLNFTNRTCQLSIPNNPYTCLGLEVKTNQVLSILLDSIGIRDALLLGNVYTIENRPFISGIIQYKQSGSIDVFTSNIPLIP